MTHDEMIAVIQAAKDGKTIQVQVNKCGDFNTTPLPSFNFGKHNYRVKVEPKILHCVYIDEVVYSRSFTEQEAKDFVSKVNFATYHKFIEVLD